MNKTKIFSELIPQPAEITSGEGFFLLSQQTKIYINVPELVKTAEILQWNILQETGLDLEITNTLGDDQIKLRVKDQGLGAEAYRLSVSEDRIVISADSPVGIFMGAQTTLQLMRPDDNSSGGWAVPLCEIEDRPRFAWRGMMLDVARHFFPPEAVRRVIDLLALYKFNRLHLHLTDDQGWRIEIKKWPKLTEIGASTQVGGGKGGFYTQEEYLGLVEYAQERFITIVPEIDMPGHTNAALASYPELNPDGKAPALYTEMEVGFSSLSVGKPITMQFVEDVIAEIAALTPGAYIHVGGDEAKSTSKEDYISFMNDVQEIVKRSGKHLVGWQEIGNLDLVPGTIVQYWQVFEEFQPQPDHVEIIMSPAIYAYIDMKYNLDSPLGLNWAGLVNVEQAFNWDPEKYLSMVSQGHVIGLEAPLWTETIETVADIEYMMFPRMWGYSEIGWAQSGERDFQEFRVRLPFHGARLKKLGVNFYRSELVDWAD